jgi:hypothetical protein
MPGAHSSATAPTHSRSSAASTPATSPSKDGKEDKDYFSGHSTSDAWCMY